MLVALYFTHVTQPKRLHIMSSHNSLKLGVNVDHIATLRQARGTTYPDPTQAAKIARLAGADGVTVHLREDRRHIQEQDVFEIRETVSLPLNFEMAATPQMLDLALELAPYECCLVPEKRQEVTTEGGLDVFAQMALLEGFISQLKTNGTLVSLFIDPDDESVDASKELGADIVELHTGSYAECDGDQQVFELQRIKNAASRASSLGLQANAGHGLHYQNVQAVAAIPEIDCLNIGHAIVSRAVMTGIHEAVFAMKQIMNGARLESEGKGL